jgi:hypothetical protein
MDEELLRRFETGEMPAGGFHHAQHVQVAWHYLRRAPLPEALVCFTSGLKAFAAAQGATGLYHETITIAFMLVINERLAEERDLDWPAFAAAHPELFTWKPSILDRYYLPETLASERARRTFVMPDRPAAPSLS